MHDVGCACLVGRVAGIMVAGGAVVRAFVHCKIQSYLKQQAARRHHWQWSWSSQQETERFLVYY